MAGVDRDVLASYLREKMEKEQVSLRRAAELIGCSPATLSRLLNGSDSAYEPDTATIVSIAKWIDRNLSDLEPAKRPIDSSMSFTELEMHMHALPKVTKEGVTEIMSVVKALYESQLKRTPN